MTSRSGDGFVADVHLRSACTALKTQRAEADSPGRASLENNR